jgi:hypothetical protein
MALGNKIVLGKEHRDTSVESMPDNAVKGIRKIRPKFSPGMRFPCQD